ncbi:hypothetical protein B0H17DRAFT_429297 [Mycena rosella]|uniref:Decapping nuclease n=1 Tax=Mycena rosella TaxID=1033263 RepID=A0AAD7CH62_MYCRO|nr:hypothetical protein B0H17DRAFT_429297 [Mycena rosella]
MASSTNPTIRLLNVADPPQCPLPALLGPAKQSACFSICGEHLEVDSTAALRYFVHPPQKANLRSGLNDFMKLPFKDRAFKRARRLDNVFKTCLDARNSDELLKAGVVTWRGIMKKIMLREKLDLVASYHNGVLYLEEDSTRSRVDPDSETIYRGHKFETLCSTATPGGKPGDTVDIHTLWNAAITRKLGSLDILLAGEVDCVTPNYTENPAPENYLELKTKKTDGQNYNIDKKKCNWEMQSYLLGTPQIFVGFVDSSGVVQKVQTLAVRDMTPAQHRFDWGARVLHSLREHCVHSVEHRRGVIKVWRVEARSQYVDIRELGPSEVKKLNKGGVPRNGIIPVSFIEGLKSRDPTV